MNRIPCGGFNIGDGLSIDPVTRTLSALGGSSSTNIIHLTWNEDHSQIVSADKTVAELVEGYNSGTQAYAIMVDGNICPMLYAFPAEDKFNAQAVFCKLNPSPSFNMDNEVSGSNLKMDTYVVTTENGADVWKIYSDSIFDYGQTSLMLRSSTTNSTKIFEIKVDDAGTVSATELTT